MSETATTTLAQHRIDPGSVQLLSQGFSRKKNVVVLGQVDPASRDPITVGMLDPNDRDLVQRLQRFLGRPVEPLALRPEQLTRALEVGYGTWKTNTRASAIDFGDHDSPTADDQQEAQAIVEELLTIAVAEGASHVHIERYPNGAGTRLRVAGELQPLASPLSVDTIDAVLTRLGTLVGISRPSGSTMSRATIQVLAGPTGEARPLALEVTLMGATDTREAIVRLTDTGRALPTLEGLGFSAEQSELLRSLLHGPEGLLLVAGPLGSETSDVLAAMLGLIDNRRNKILTLEENIAVRIDGVRHEARDRSRPYVEQAEELRAADPDVLMFDTLAPAKMGEVAQQAVHQGVRVLAGIWAHDFCGALATVRELGLSEAQLPSLLRGVVVRRSLRTLCPHCTQPAADDERAERAFASYGQRIAHWRANGCERCGGRGYAGRQALFEVIPIEGQLAEVIAGDADAQAIDRAIASLGVRRLRQAGVALVAVGRTDFAEFERVLGRPPSARQ